MLLHGRPLLQNTAATTAELSLDVLWVTASCAGRFHAQENRTLERQLGPWENRKAFQIQSLTSSWTKNCINIKLWVCKNFMLWALSYESEWSIPLISLSILTSDTSPSFAFFSSVCPWSWSPACAWGDKEGVSAALGSSSVALILFTTGNKLATPVERQTNPFRCKITLWWP